jgi:hypothetical protein
MARDGCIVDAQPFAVLVRAHVSRWRAEHPCDARERNENGYFDGLTEGQPIQALVWLSATASHLADPDGRLPRLVVSRGLLEGLLTGKHEVIELRVADAVALALDAPYAAAGIEVMPNPLASREAQKTCCGEQSHTEEWGTAQPLPIAV